MQLNKRQKEMLLKMRQKGGPYAAISFHTSGYFATTHLVMLSLVKMKMINALGKHVYTLTALGIEKASSISKECQKRTETVKSQKRGVSL